MKNALWFVLGIAGGFVAAHLVNKDPRGHEVLAEVDARISEFTERIGDAYRAQEAKIEGLVADAKSAATEAVDTVRDAAHALEDAAEDGAARLTD
ncbi:MAG: ATPase [Microbacterium sp.]|nr:MAG: ATPase [Microbacterium sp.]